MKINGPGQPSKAWNIFKKFIGFQFLRFGGISYGDNGLGLSSCCRAVNSIIISHNNVQ